MLRPTGTCIATGRSIVISSQNNERVNNDMKLSTIWPGNPHPLGTHWDGQGVNFAMFSEHAEKVELRLFDDKGSQQRGEQKA